MSDGSAQGTESAAETTAGGRGFGGYLQLLLVIAVVVAGLYFGQAPKRATVDPTEALGAEAAPPLVNVVMPSRAAHSAGVTLTGAVGPHSLVTMMMSNAGGRVVWVSPILRFGGAFAANEPLLRVDSIDYDILMKIAEAELRRAQAELRKEELKGAAESARFLSGNPGIEVPPLVARVPQIEAARALVEERMNELERRKLALSRTEMSLPFEGRITRTQVGVGQVLGPMSVIGLAYSRDVMEIGAGITNEDLAYLSPTIGRKATIMVDKEIFDGEVVRESAAIDPTTRLTRLFLKFADEIPIEDIPLPGSFASIQIQGPEFDESFLLPNAAEQAGGHVWVVRDGVLESHTPLVLRQAVTGWLDSPGNLVRAFDAGDGIVLGTVFGAHDGMSVRIRDAVDG